jgi:hypothetical protein
MEGSRAGSTFFRAVAMYQRLVKLLWSLQVTPRQWMILNCPIARRCLSKEYAAGLRRIRKVRGSDWYSAASRLLQKRVSVLTTIMLDKDISPLLHRRILHPEA